MKIILNKQDEVKTRTTSIPPLLSRYKYMLFNYFLKYTKRIIENILNLFQKKVIYFFNLFFYIYKKKVVVHENNLLNNNNI